MWLVNELDLTFLAPIKYAKTQFNSIILTEGVSKRKDFMEITKVIFYIKPIPSHIIRM